MSRQDHTNNANAPIAVAILGGDPVVGRSLELMLESAGYNARFLNGSFVDKPAELPEEYAATFREDERAWAWFSEQPPSYRKAATWWVVSAKREETRQRRLAALIGRSAARRRIDALSPP